MKSLSLGKNTLNVEVTNISEHGIWLLVIAKEYFLPFSDYPWFKDATIAQIHDVKLLHETHLFWEKLDIDLSINILNNSEKYKLVYS